MAKFQRSAWSSLLPISLLPLLLILHAQLGSSAPTHHLSITVEGDTPMLVVTSSETDISPDILYTTTMAGRTVGMATAAAEAPASRQHKNVATKPKNKSTKLQIAKKTQTHYAAKQKTVWQTKMAATTVATTTETTTTTTTAPALQSRLSVRSSTTATDDNAEIQYETALPTTTAAATASNDVASTAARQVDAADALQATTPGSVPSAPQTTAAPEKTATTTFTPKVDSESAPQAATSSSTSTSAVDDATFPARWSDDIKSLPKAKAIKPNAKRETMITAQSTTTTPPAMMTTTQTSFGAAVAAIATTAKTASTSTETSMASVITTEADFDTADEAKGVAAVAEIRSRFDDVPMASVATTAAVAGSVRVEEASTLLPVATQANVSPNRESESSVSTTERSSSVKSVDNMQLTSLPTTSTTTTTTATRSTIASTAKLLAPTTKALTKIKPLPATTKIRALSTAPTTTVAAAAHNLGVLVDVRHKQRPQHENDGGAIKLIDLENHDLESIGDVEVQQQQQQQQHSYGQHTHDDGGHDGVKQTKKKQLIDKHFLAGTDTDADTDKYITTSGSPSDSSSATSYTTTAIATGNDKNSNSDNDSDGGKTDVLTAMASASVDMSPQNVAKPTTAATPTLVPVHNGYLGPIFMEERTFSVVHANKAPQSHPNPHPHSQHEPSIESQLRDGRIVEIIAPTAAFEQTKAAAEATTTTTPAVNETPTTTVMPPMVHHVEHLQHTPVLSTTVFQVLESLPSTTRLPTNSKLLPLFPRGSEALERSHWSARAEQTESKISDIQIEVYDSTVDSIVASTNFKDNDGYYALPLESVLGTTKPPAAAVSQERFTQYVVDRTDSSTQESSVIPLHAVAGKPEPAAIEIHINVSEGVGNESEDLEFSYQQADYMKHVKPNGLNNFALKTSKPISVKTFSSVGVSKSYTSEPSDEILVVEIIDTGDNSTENSASAENINPIFTFHSDSDADVELKEIRYVPQETVIRAPQSSDELFLADVKKQSDAKYLQPPPPPPPPPRRPSIDHDSDTIFYISNTEVKVGESLPTPSTNYQQQQQLQQARLESQFFPANYVPIPHSSSGRVEQPLMAQQLPHRYEEDIILSPLRDTANSLKIVRNSGDGAPPLDVTYVGESIMEVEQSSGAGIGTTSASSYAAPQAADVIIQPAILPEMSIGVPVIGELPPQIELKEIDFMPDEANQLRSGVYENDIEESSNINGNANGNDNDNDVDRLVESSIQYGGDLIDEDARAGFDGIEGSYPFGNPAALRRRGGRHDADYAHLSLNHGVSNLQKDELSVDVGSSGEVVAANKVENATLRELLSRNGNETAANASYALTERMSNATAFSVAEERSDEELEFSNVLSLIIGLFVVLLPVVVTVSMACALRYLYVKYRLSASDNEDNIEAQRANGSAGKGGEKGESTPKSSSPTRIREQNEENAQKENNSNESENSQKPSTNSTPNFVDESEKDAHIQYTGSKEAKSETPIETFNSVQEQHKSNPNIVSYSNDNSNQSAQHSSTLKSNHTGPNGSVTKMTLKNNHLIIETEERNDISRDARETKMHYNTSDKDGAFVVEVARGVDSKSVPDSPVADSKLDDFAAKEITNAVLIAEDEKLLMTQEEVQIHQPPPEVAIACPAEELPRSLHQIEEVEEPTPSPNCVVGATALPEETQLAQNSNTGLSQSDLSSSSSTDSNKRYSYGNQELYIIEQPGYATTSPTAHVPLAIAMPDETSDDDRKPENGHSLEHSPAQANDSVQNTETPCKLSKASAKQQLPNSADECQLNGHVEYSAHTTNDSDISAIIEKSAEEKGSQLQKDAVLVPSEAVSNTITAAIPNDTDAQTEADSVADAAQTACDTTTNSKHDHSSSHDNMTHVVNDETEAENAYDSIISLPAPPSTDEIKQLNDYSSLDTNQLDSLPPPPPPLLGGASEEDQHGSADEMKLQNMVAQAKGKLQAEPLATTGPPKQAPPMQINGDSDKCNGHEVATFMSILPPPPPTPPSPLTATTHVQMANNGKMLPAPLTPPASPPPSPPAHFGNVVHGGMSCVPLPVAVDVNGS